jgi:hypothetical protein
MYPLRPTSCSPVAYGPSPRTLTGNVPQLRGKRDRIAPGFFFCRGGKKESRLSRERKAKAACLCANMGGFANPLSAQLVKDR